MTNPLDPSTHYPVALSDAYSGYAALKPPNRVRVSEGATTNLVIKQTGAAGGNWDGNETPYMIQPMDSLASRQHEAVVFVGPARTGKCLDVDTPIPTPDGWTRMGDLREGDTVFGSNGRQIRVLAAHDVKHGLLCYEVEFSDGSRLVADSEHLWGVERFYWKEPNWRYEVRSTESMLDDFRYSMRGDGRGRYRYRVRNAKPLECPDVGVLIDPYVLGIWLGNGTATSSVISSHNEDVRHYACAIRDAGHTATTIPDGPNTSWTRIDHIDHPNEDLFGRMQWRLRQYGLLSNKHIPSEYLRASFTQRLRLLQGLMDTDGYSGGEGRSAVEFSTVSDRLKDGFCELVRTFGLRPRAHLATTSWVHNGERRFGQAWRIGFSVPPGLPVFSLPRKAAGLDPATIDIGFRQIVDIRPVPTRPVRCIQVDAPDNLFLAGEGMIPTHNTAALLQGWMAHNVVNDPGDMLLLSMTKDTARTFSKTDIDRAIRNSPNIHAMKSPRVVDSNTFDTMFRHGMWLRIAWPTISNVSGATYRYVAITDIDRIENAENVDGEGPLFDLAKKRTTTFLSRGMTLVESSPGKPILDPAWQAATPHEAPPVGGILALYNRSDRHRWYWACPDCQARFEAAPGLGLFNLPPEAQLLDEVRTANIQSLAKHHCRIVCPHCGSMIEPRWKTMLNSTGIWTPDTALDGAPMQSTIAGFWLGGVAAAFQSWQSLLEQYFYGLRDFALNGSEEKLKTTTNTDQGAPYMSRHLREALAGTQRPADRAEVGLPRYIVPDETRCVMASVDVQGGSTARFEGHVVAIGAHGEKWVVDRFDIRKSKREGIGAEFAPIDPAAYAEDWDVLTERLLRATWRTSDPTREIRLTALAVDTGGEDGVTHNAYAWYRRVRKLGLANRVVLYKGGSEPKAPIIRENWVGKTSAKSKPDIPLLVCNPNLLSDMVYADLKRQTPGPGYIHLPAPRHPTLNPDGWVSQAVFDELEAEVRGANGTWSKVRPRNEWFDLFRMLYAAMLRKGLDKVKDWNTVPAWLAPLDRNSEVVYAQDRREANEVAVETVADEVRVVAPRRRPRRYAQASL